ncbi:MAG: hypothetical protein SVY53_10370 [Chloroflexota bacterium]|nr:hypothetical protein [Chloroflexota bacterium]
MKLVTDLIGGKESISLTEASAPWIPVCQTVLPSDIQQIVIVIPDLVRDPALPAPTRFLIVVGNDTTRFFSVTHTPVAVSRSRDDIVTQSVHGNDNLGCDLS